MVLFLTWFAVCWERMNPERLCRSAMIWRVFFLSSVFAPEQEAVTIFCEIFSSVSKSKLLQNLSWNHNDLMSEMQTQKSDIFFLWKRWTSRTVQDQTPNWSFRAQCTQHQTANEPRGTLAEASKELPHNKTACCSTLRYWRQHTGLVEWGEKQPKNKLLFVLNSKYVLVSADSILRL